MNLESKKQDQENVYWKRLLFTALIGGFSMWVVAGIWHTILAVHFYKNETNAEHKGLSVILLAYLILGLLMTHIYTNSHRSSTTLEGFYFGAIMGVLWVFPHELAMAGAHGESISYVFKNGLWHIIEQGLGGMVISIVYNYRKKSKLKTK